MHHEICNNYVNMITCNYVNYKILFPLEGKREIKR